MSATWSRPMILLMEHGRDGEAYNVGSGQAVFDAHGAGSSAGAGGLDGGTAAEGGAVAQHGHAGGARGRLETAPRNRLVAALFARSDVAGYVELLERSSHENRSHRHRLRRPGHRHLLRGERQRRRRASTRTRARSQTLERGEMPIYEPGLQELVQRNRQRRPAALHDRPARRRRAGPADLHRRRHAAGRRRLRRPVQRLGRRRRHGHAPRTGRRSSSSRARSRSAPIAAVAERMAQAADAPVRRGQQSGVPQGRRRHRRLARSPTASSSACAGPRSAKCCTSCTRRSCAPSGRFWSCRRKAPR